RRWCRLMLQAAAALLVVLGEEVSLLGLFIALEGGQGYLERLADLARVAQAEAEPEYQGDVHQCSNEQGEAQPIRGAHAATGEVAGMGRCVHCGSGRYE